MSDKNNNDDAQQNKKKLKRSSQDFEPDMDSLLVTAQSSMIIDAIDFLVKKNYSLKTRQTYVEAIKGVELFIKILQRSSKGYSKIQKTINMDSDSKKVELFAFGLFKKIYKIHPLSDDSIITAYEILKEKLKSGYYKCLVISSINDTKKLLLLSGGINRDKIDDKIKSKNIEFIDIMEKMKKRIHVAIELLKNHDAEIEKGMKGKDVSIFIIQTSEILQYYYQKVGNHKEANYFKKIHDTYKKYFIVRK